MIPTVNRFLEVDFGLEEEPSKTYRLDIHGNTIRGYTDEREAVKQAIYKILHTERYQYIIYSWNYGVELLDLYGEPVSYVCPELERRIREALLWDSRITDVGDFSFDTSRKGRVSASFTAHTLFGDVLAEKEVAI